jgi:hypothetical protein
MSELKKLQVYLEKIKLIAESKVKEDKTSAIDALKQAINYVEGEMIGY